MKNIVKVIMAAGVLFAFYSCGPTTVVYTDAPPELTVQVIPIAPPAVVVVTGPGDIRSPGMRHVWIDGYWQWDPVRRDYLWVNGYWAETPYSGAVWLPGYWDHRGSRGYVWVNATWAPKGYSVPYGYSKTRFDYYGRTVYYARPVDKRAVGHVYCYDHRPQYTNRSYSSYAAENNSRSKTPTARPAPRTNSRTTRESTNNRTTRESTNREAVRSSTDNESSRSSSRTSRDQNASSGSNESRSTSRESVRGGGGGGTEERSTRTAPANNSRSQNSSGTSTRSSSENNRSESGQNSRSNSRTNSGRGR